nr:mitogen-activated protein kinase kinase kinase 18-like [Ipomoea batatas]GME18995.1 mitogen-activated protein kinase kinase kinase 18-like [Ipomoea batatas]
MWWTKQRFLGSGSYGQVYLAVQPENMEIAAVKSGTIVNRGINSLIQEGQFLYSLRASPYIVRCFGEDTSVENGVEVYNLLLEYATGGTLGDLLRSREGGLPESNVAWYAYQLLKGIHYVHSRNWIKLCDFGLAKTARGCNFFGDNHRGALRYAPPESLRWRQYDAPKDIWALGCIVVQMITGKSAWEFSYDCNILSTENSVSPSALDFLRNCFQWDPRRRWTAEMLLSHQFIVRNNHWFEIEEREEDEGPLKNPFGSADWNSSENLFTVGPPSTSCFDIMESYNIWDNHDILSNFA